jgi:hypothetical protein
MLTILTQHNISLVFKSPPEEKHTLVVTKYFVFKKESKEKKNGLSFQPIKIIHTYCFNVHAFIFKKWS